MSMSIGDIHADVWTTIFPFLSDYDIIALSGLSKTFRDLFDDPIFYTARLRLRWIVCDGAKIDGTCVSREMYINVCHHFDQWKKSVRLIGATHVRLEVPASRVIPLRVIRVDKESFRSKQETYLSNGKISFRVTDSVYKELLYINANTENHIELHDNVRYELLPLVFPRKWYNQLHNERKMFSIAQKICFHAFNNRNN